MDEPCRLPEWHEGDCAPVNDEDYARALQEPGGSDWERRRAEHIAEVEGEAPSVMDRIAARFERFWAWLEDRW